MRIKLKNNQPREVLIFTVKKLTDAFEDEMSDTIFYFTQDIEAATAQNNHNKLVEALNGLKGVIDSQELDDLGRLTYRLIGLVDMDQ